VILLDVNVLVYAHREDLSEHGSMRAWLERVVAQDEPFALAELVLSGFLRIVTHSRVFATPTPLEGALAVVEALRERPNCVVISPGPRHWDIFLHLCRTANARGRLVPDAYLAALV